MNFALTHPDKVDRLIVVDISPKAYNLEHYTIVKGLLAIPIDSLKSRNEADEILSQHVPEHDVRQFLLKNLQRKAEGGLPFDNDRLGEDLDRLVVLHHPDARDILARRQRCHVNRTFDDAP